MKTEIDLDTWKRKSHFEFFSAMDEPFYGLTVEIDVTKAYEKAKALNTSFFIYYLYAALKTMNQLPAFKLRIDNGKVFQYNRIDASSTVLKKNETFGFSHIIYQEDLELFQKSVKNEIARVQQTDTLLTKDDYGENIIHFSAIPWVNFTSLTHARGFQYPDSAPKVSIGKMMDKNGRKFFNVALFAHHGLVDGIDMGRFFDLFQDILNE
ncbi:chloramphenicol acetyltransferase [Flavobacterium sp. CBA20B-1]|uniref:chloramphenicol acetyltransferase n=1 Tax=unclassified Flavobacterium TaxID=196869 RepID=UPI0022253C26|nr:MULTISPECIES: chloramphenicol acetyltransferase [unclassified Flavobacterium]WCM41638.1 chloramphenicol acetyltransferase [Flavobacterium sp. CBA20B-1]